MTAMIRGLARRGSLRAAALAILVLAMTALSGCLYPDDATPGHDASDRQAVLAVQDAVDRYKEATGLLPIVSAGESTPVYEKFKIDLGKLKRMDYLGSIPAAAFENGGHNQFLVIDEETKPTVKLLNIPAFQQATTVQGKVDAYMDKHGGKPPLGEERYPGFWSVDFKKLSASEPDVRSMYSGQSLSFLTDEAGRVYYDYALDIATAVRKSGKTPSADEDLRRVLVDESYYVPVKSPVYAWASGEPVARPEN